MDQLQSFVTTELSVLLLHEWSDHRSRNLRFINECCYCLDMFMACASHRCSSLFSVAVEWKLHPEEVESEVCRSRLQLFSLAGGASRTDLRGSVTYTELSITWSRGAKNDIVMFSWVLQHYQSHYIKSGLITWLSQGMHDHQSISVFPFIDNLLTFTSADVIDFYSWGIFYEGLYEVLQLQMPFLRSYVVEL